MPENPLERIRAPQLGDHVAQERAEKEESDLFEQKRRRRRRKDREQASLHFLFIAAIWAFAVLAFLCVVILTVHYAAPPSWRWLADSDLEKLRTNLGSVLIGGILSKYLERRFKQTDEEPK